MALLWSPLEVEPGDGPQWTDHVHGHLKCKSDHFFESEVWSRFGAIAKLSDCTLGSLQVCLNSFEPANEASGTCLNIGFKKIVGLYSFQELFYLISSKTEDLQRTPVLALFSLFCVFLSCNTLTDLIWDLIYIVRIWRLDGIQKQSKTTKEHSIFRYIPIFPKDTPRFDSFLVAMFSMCNASMNGPLLRLVLAALASPHRPL